MITCLLTNLNACTKRCVLLLDQDGHILAEQPLVLPDNLSPQQLTGVNGVQSTGAALAIDGCQWLWYQL